jgi:hypothetical protein
MTASGGIDINKHHGLPIACGDGAHRLTVANAANSFTQRQLTTGPPLSHNFVAKVAARRRPNGKLLFLMLL